MTDSPRPTPEQEAVRRLLAESRHDGPTPPEVVARLDEALASLVAERGTDPLVSDEPAPARVTDLGARRRRLAGVGLLAAAAVVVAGVALGQALPRSGDDTAGGGDAATADRESSLAESAQPGAEDDSSGRVRRDRARVPQEHAGRPRRRPPDAVVGRPRPRPAGRRPARGPSRASSSARPTRSGRCELPADRLRAPPRGTGRRPGRRAGLPAPGRRGPAGRGLRLRRPRARAYAHAPRSLSRSSPGGVRVTPGAGRTLAYDRLSTS